MKGQSQMTQYHFNNGMIEYYNKDGYIVDHYGKIVLDHKGKKIFIPKEYREKSNMWKKWGFD